MLMLTVGLRKVASQIVFGSEQELLVGGVVSCVACGVSCITRCVGCITSRISCITSSVTGVAAVISRAAGQERNGTKSKQ